MQNTSTFPTRILLAIDDSEEAALATQKAVSLANGTDSELHLVYVGQLPNRFMDDPDTLGFNRKLYYEIERNALEMLWKLTMQVKAAGGIVDGAHLGMGGSRGDSENSRGARSRPHHHGQPGTRRGKVGH